MTESDRQTYRRRLRGRNIATLCALLGFVVLLYVVAIVRMSGI